MADTPPLARRMPGFEGRHATRRARRIRSVGAIVVVVAVAVFLVVHFTQHSTPPPTVPRRPAAPVTPRVVTTLATWRLGAPISRAVVLPGTAPGGTHLVILGGTTTGGLTASGAFDLNVTDGTLTQVGDLMTTLDDASGAVLGGEATVFGGTSSPSTPASSSVQSFPAATTTAGSASSGTAVPTSTSLGTLPQARAAASAVTAGPTTYLVGGDNVAGPVAAVVATTDGRHFTTVASLPVPVLYPALAVVGHTLYVFGGTAADGSETGQPVTTIQDVNLKSGKVIRSGHLPQPLTGSAAAVLGHDVLLAGGDTASAPGTASSTTAASSTATVVTTSVDSIWSFNPATGTFSGVGHLAVAVSHSGVAVLGSTAWLVGGESNGTPVSAVQSFVVAPPSK